MPGTLDELKEGFPFERVSPSAFEFRVGMGERAEIWSVTIIGGYWKVRCDEAERSFPTEAEACAYFWKRFRQRPLS